MRPFSKQEEEKMPMSDCEKLSARVFASAASKKMPLMISMYSSQMLQVCMKMSEVRRMEKVTFRYDGTFLVGHTVMLGRLFWPFGCYNMKNLRDETAVQVFFSIFTKEDILKFLGVSEKQLHM